MIASHRLVSGRVRVQMHGLRLEAYSGPCCFRNQKISHYNSYFCPLWENQMIWQHYPLILPWFLRAEGMMAAPLCQPTYPFLHNPLLSIVSLSGNPLVLYLLCYPTVEVKGKWKIPELKDASKGFGIPSVFLYHNTCHHWPCMHVTVNLDLGFQTKTSLQNSWKSHNYNRSYII